MPTRSDRRVTPKPAHRRTAAINIRVPKRTRRLIDRAAAIAGKTRSEFMLESATQQATDVLLDQRLVALDPEAHDAFLQVLDNPPAPTDRLKALFRARAPWES